MFPDQRGRPPLGLAQEPSDLLVDDPLRLLGVLAGADLLRAEVLRSLRREPDRAQREGSCRTRSPCAWRVASRPPGRWPRRWTPRRTRRARRNGHPCGPRGSPAGSPRSTGGARLREAARSRRAPGPRAGSSPWPRVGVLGEDGDERVPALVHGDRMLLVGHQRVRRIAPAEQDAVARIGEVRRRDHVAAGADGEDRRLVHQVGQVRARRTRASRAPRPRGRRRDRAPFPSRGPAGSRPALAGSAAGSPPAGRNGRAATGPDRGSPVGSSRR